MKDGLQKSDLDIKYVGFRSRPSSWSGTASTWPSATATSPDVVEYTGPNR